jgi:arginyl-tRNA synthetase
MKPLKKKIREEIKNLLSNFFDLKDLEFRVGAPKPELGDYYTNVAFSLAKREGKNVKKMADEVASILFKSEIFESAEPLNGFVNIRVKKSVIENMMREFLRGEKIEEKKERILIEFVSANPTGPIHIGHGRGAVIGDSLARVFSHLGYNVQREFYINDAGGQILSLLNSVDLYRKKLIDPSFEIGEDVEYQGEYVEEIAKKLSDNIGFEEKKKMVLFLILEEIKNTLNEFRVDFDTWISEESFYKNGAVEEVVDWLRKMGYVEEKDSALWFVMKGLEEDKDRVLRRKDGRWTYFAGDIAYHKYKYERGYDLLINVWGADHHGYLPRLRGAIKAMGFDENKLKIVWVQMVKLVREGKPVPMSKRKGEYITLKDVIDEVGTDVTRFFFLMRRADTPLEFDLELAKKETEENPVFYVQYAYARIRSIFEELKKRKMEYEEGGFSTKLLNEEEEKLLRKFIKLNDVLYDVTESLEPHLIVQFLLEIVPLFHQFYTKHRVLVENKVERNHRLEIIKCMQKTIETGLSLIGVKTPEGRM